MVHDHHLHTGSFSVKHAEFSNFLNLFVFALNIPIFETYLNFFAIISLLFKVCQASTVNLLLFTGDVNEYHDNRRVTRYSDNVSVFGYHNLQQKIIKQGKRLLSFSLPKLSLCSTLFVLGRTCCLPQAIIATIICLKGIIKCHFGACYPPIHVTISHGS